MRDEISTPMWVTEDVLREYGYLPAAPEHDFGQNWGSGGSTRITFAPSGNGDEGYLYAYDRTTDRYAVLAAETTLAAVSGAYEVITSERPRVDNYLLFAGLLNLDTELSMRDVHVVWKHCVEREAVLRSRFEALNLDDSTRFATAHGFVVARGARVAAEELQVKVLDPAGCDFGIPVLVNYRVPERPDWHGRVAGSNVGDAAFRIADVTTILSQFGYSAQATSLRHGHTIVAASRVHELERFAAPVRVERSFGVEL